MKYRITYDTTATLIYLVEAASEDEARQRWQDESPFDFDHADFADGAAGTPTVRLTRLEMLKPATSFAIEEAPERQAVPAR